MCVCENGKMFEREDYVIVDIGVVERGIQIEECRFICKVKLKLRNMNGEN